MAMMRLKHGNDVIEIVDLATSFARRIGDEIFSSGINWYFRIHGGSRRSAIESRIFHCGKNALTTAPTQL